jgi:hypothetical protein
MALRASRLTAGEKFTYTRELWPELGDGVREAA